MRASPLFLPLALVLSLGAQPLETRTHRQWMGGQEVGGSTQTLGRDGAFLEVQTHEWTRLERLGQEIRQDLQESARKGPDGKLTFTWRLQLSAEPFEGVATWSPREPRVLRLNPARGAATRQQVPANAVLWPEDLEARLKAAARLRKPVIVRTFSFPTQQWSELSLAPQGPAPLPGFPDALRFTGVEKEGGVTQSVESWISPTAGEVRHQADLGGLRLLSQRAELPPPTPPKAPQTGFFEQTLQPLPPHPFQPWIPDLILRAEGPAPHLPEDAQQRRMDASHWRLRQAKSPTRAEASQPPIRGIASPAEAPYMRPSPLVPFEDPAFGDLLQRLALPPGLSRWELAQRVTTFVFDWITEKDYTVGFASALEVCHTPRGDCTEHGVLAVALLRRLGVPSRGVTGWVALGETWGLHFWVEVRLGHRWVPVDPTFDQAPASAFRLKLSHTDLADLGGVGWEAAATAFSGTRWIPEREGPVAYGGGWRTQGDTLLLTQGLSLRCLGGRWHRQGSDLQLTLGPLGPWSVRATVRPSSHQLRGAQRLKGSREAWWRASGAELWIRLPEGRWLILHGPTATEAEALVNQLALSATST